MQETTVASRFQVLISGGLTPKFLCVRWFLIGIGRLLLIRIGRLLAIRIGRFLLIGVRRLLTIGITWLLAIRIAWLLAIGIARLLAIRVAGLLLARITLTLREGDEGCGAGAGNDGRCPGHESACRGEK